MNGNSTEIKDCYQQNEQTACYLLRIEMNHNYTACVDLSCIIDNEIIHNVLK